MNTWLKVLLVGGAAYIGYEMFFATATATATTTAPASWTNVGGTAAQWASMTATNQAVWNAMAVSSQTAAQLASLLAYGSAASPVGTTLAAAATPAATVPASWPSGITSLATLATAIQAQAASDPNLVNGNMPSGDNWNYYANQIMGKSFTPAWPTGSISFAAYWAGEAPVIGAQTGLGSIMAGLGALVNRQRRSMGMGDYESSAFTPPRLTNNPAIPNDWN